jgi:hypothetical protein
MFFETAGQFSAWQKHNPLAGQTFQADVRSQPDDLPVKPAARMRFAQGDDIFQNQLGQHKQIIPYPP